jgi:hypothetical protein
MRKTKDTNEGKTPADGRARVLARALAQAQDLRAVRGGEEMVTAVTVTDSNDITFIKSDELY